MSHTFDTVLMILGLWTAVLYLGRCIKSLAKNRNIPKMWLLALLLFLPACPEKKPPQPPRRTFQGVIVEGDPVDEKTLSSIVARTKELCSPKPVKEIYIAVKGEHIGVAYQCVE